MILNFCKYHGTGNDFIIVDNREQNLDLKHPIIKQLCSRHTGIGADGLIFLENSERAEFRMVYFNADGHEGTMCGNGGRCFVSFAKHLGLIKNETKFEAIDGMHNAFILSHNEKEMTIKISLNDVTEWSESNGSVVINTGSPHYVRFVDDLDKINPYQEGKKLRWNEKFQPEGVNVNFVQIQEDKLHIRTFERGVENITLSCGTGTVASVLAAFLKGKITDTKITAVTPGGDLSVNFNFENKIFRNIWLEGPSKKVFTGQAEI